MSLVDPISLYKLSIVHEFLDFIFLQTLFNIINYFILNFLHTCQVLFFIHTLFSICILKESFNQRSCIKNIHVRICMSLRHSQGCFHQCSSIIKLFGSIIKLLKTFFICLEKLLIIPNLSNISI